MKDGGGAKKRKARGRKTRIFSSVCACVCVRKRQSKQEMIKKTKVGENEAREGGREKIGNKRSKRERGELEKKRRGSGNRKSKTCIVFWVKNAN